MANLSIVCSQKLTLMVGAVKGHGLRKILKMCFMTPFFSPLWLHVPYPRGMIDAAGSGGAVTGGAVTGGAVTGGAVTGGAVTGGAVTGGLVGRSSGKGTDSHENLLFRPKLQVHALESVFGISPS